MAQPASIFVLPVCMHADEEDALDATATVAREILEDLRLAECVERALRATGYRDLCDIEVFVSARVVHLVGRVPSYHMKQIAQVTALAVPGAHQVHNEVDVIH
jgi:osmotically-inducible protein OsmY